MPFGEEGLPSVTRPATPDIEAGWSFWLQAFDSQSPSVPDAMTFLWTSDMPVIDFGPNFPGICSTPLWTDPFGLVPVTAGQIVIHDALP
jgi:hypothetical protein